jgi:hypothetical protein
MSESVEFKKSAYIALTNSTSNFFEEAVEEYIDILNDDDASEVETSEAMRGIVNAALTQLAIQRKLNKYLTDNVPAPTDEAVEFALEVAETVGIEGFSVKTAIVADPANRSIESLLKILVEN